MTSVVYSGLNRHKIVFGYLYSLMSQNAFSLFTADKLSERYFLCTVWNHCVPSVSISKENVSCLFCFFLVKRNPMTVGFRKLFGFLKSALSALEKVVLSGEHEVVTGNDRCGFQCLLQMFMPLPL